MATGEQLENISEPSYKQLNPRQAFDYDAHLDQLSDWLLDMGKDPDLYEGYSEDGVDNYIRRLDQIYRWVWNKYGGYTTTITQEQADEFIDALAADRITTQNGEPYSTCSKRKMKNALEALFRWREYECDESKWEPSLVFADDSYSPPDEFTVEERRKLREAVLEYDSVPKYSYLSPEERDRWKGYIAQRLGKPKEGVVPADWNRLNTSWKIPSLIRVTLDTGLRPCEVEKASLSWIRSEKEELHIPKEDSAKNKDHWSVALSPKTADTLDRWIEERKNYAKYDGRDEIWLNREGNPYQSKSLNRLLRNLCEVAEIDLTNRDIVWYSFRHSLGKYMVDKGNLAQAKEQLRHERLETTLKYKSPSHEATANTLHQIG